MRNAISVVSTYTKDVLIDEGGMTLAKQDGGPAYFISSALQNEQTPFNCHSGESVTVEIIITPDGEFGRLSATPKSHPMPANLSEWTIISTVLDEWSLDDATLPKYACLDLQGYVRNGRDFGRKQEWVPTPTIVDSLFCIKGTKEELLFLPEGIITHQKQRLLVVTDGAAGIDVYYKGRRTYIAVRHVVGLKDTIGAGDTFFAYFVAALSRGDTPVSAASKAAVRTTEFLERKLIS